MEDNALSLNGTHNETYALTLMYRGDCVVISNARLQTYHPQLTLNEFSVSGILNCKKINFSELPVNICSILNLILIIVEI